MEHTFVKGPRLSCGLVCNYLVVVDRSSVHASMPFDSRQHGGPDPALAPAVPVPRLRRPPPLVGGVDWKVAVLALAVAAALIAGLAWNLMATQSQARDSLDDAIQRRAGLTADVIASTFLSSRTPAAASKEFGGGPQALRRAVLAASAAPRASGDRARRRGPRARDRRCGERSEPVRAPRRPARPARDGNALRRLRGRPGRTLVELAVPFRAGRGAVSSWRRARSAWCRASRRGSSPRPRRSAPRRGT